MKKILFFLLLGTSLHPFSGESFQERITSERLRGSMLTHNTLELKNTFDEMKDSGMNSAVRRQIMDDLKAEFSLSTFTLNWDDGNDNIKINHANERVLSVSPEFQLNENLANGVGFPTIQGALDHINSQDLTTAADQKTSWVVNVESGSYDESLTVSAGRLITLNALGRVTLGDGASNNFGSTTPRDITWYQNSSAEVGSVIPTLFLNTTNCPEQTASVTKNSFYAGGWDISGNFNVANYTGLGTRYQLHMYGIKVRGNVALTTVSTDTLDTYLLQCNVGGNWSDSTIAFPANNLLKIENCKIDGTVACRDYGRIVSSEFGGTITQRNELSTDITGAGFWNCKLAAANAFNGAATFVYDENTRYLTTGDSITVLSNGGNGGNYAVTQNVINASLSNMDWKESCRVATTANIALSGLQTIDGTALATDDRVLVKGQVDAKQNGIYVAASGAWSRSPDMDGTPANEVSAGNYTTIERGTLFAGSGWMVSGDGTLTIGVDDITWIRVDIGTTAGDGLTSLDNTINVVANADGTITVNADNIQVNQSIAYSWPEAHTFANTTDSSDKDSGSIICEGGVGIEKDLNVGATVNIASMLPSTSSTTGALTVDGGVSVSDTITSTNYVFRQAPLVVYDKAAGDSSGTTAFNVLWTVPLRTDSALVTLAANTYEWTLNKSGWYNLSFNFLIIDANLNTSYEVILYKKGTPDTVYRRGMIFDTSMTPDGSRRDIHHDFLVQSDGDDTYYISVESASDTDFSIYTLESGVYDSITWEFIGT